MEYNNSAEISDSQSQPCPGCQTFFGTKETNYMCSQCWKNTQTSNTSSTNENKPLSQTEPRGEPSVEPLNTPSKAKIADSHPISTESEPKVEEKKLEETEAPKPKVSINST